MALIALTPARPDGLADTRDGTCLQSSHVGLAERMANSGDTAAARRIPLAPLAIQQ